MKSSPLRRKPQRDQLVAGMQPFAAQGAFSLHDGCLKCGWFRFARHWFLQCKSVLQKKSMIEHSCGALLASTRFFIHVPHFSLCALLRGQTKQLTPYAEWRSVYARVACFPAAGHYPQLRAMLADVSFANTPAGGLMLKAGMVETQRVAQGVFCLFRVGGPRTWAS